MLRRIFISKLLKTGAAALFAGSAFDTLTAAERKVNGITLREGEIFINADLEKPLKFLHITDSHLVEIDGRDADRNELAAKRLKAYAWSHRFFLRTMEYARRNNLTVLCTGDSMDFVTHKGLEWLKENMGADDVVFAVGNHEFSYYVGSKKEREHNPQTCALIQSCFKYDIDFHSRVIGGLNILTIDNTQYQFSAKQLEKLKAEIRRGLPILAMFHIPVYTEKFFDTIMAKNSKRKCAYLAGVPEDKLALYDSEGLRKFHRPTKTTLEFAELLKTSPAVKGVLCGHVHHFVMDTLPNGAIISAGAAGAGGKAQEIVVK